MSLPVTVSMLLFSVTKYCTVQVIIF